MASIRIHYLSADCVGLLLVPNADPLSRISVMFVQNRNAVFVENFFHLEHATSVVL
ncbi:MAG: hypothetical protein KAR33_13015 [Candidatus Thorarchaeota archaeon]|nr:hypothetical protein [Candidatus Thorarchaeota archaeon]